MPVGAEGLHEGVFGCVGLGKRGAGECGDGGEEVGVEVEMELLDVDVKAEKETEVVDVGEDVEEVEIVQDVTPSVKVEVGSNTVAAAGDDEDDRVDDGQQVVTRDVA